MNRQLLNVCVYAVIGGLCAGFFAHEVTKREKKMNKILESQPACCHTHDAQGTLK
jgi:hypothetical protein